MKYNGNILCTIITFHFCSYLHARAYESVYMYTYYILYINNKKQRHKIVIIIKLNLVKEKREIGNIHLENN